MLLQITYYQQLKPHCYRKTNMYGFRQIKDVLKMENKNV